jgi:hypothetical protein
VSAARDLWGAPRAELRRRLLEGHPVDPRDLEGWAFRGTSLGLPGFVERLTWKTFQKTFWRHPVTGRLLGWNVRLEQDGTDAPSRPRLRGGEPHTTWHYEVVEPRGVRVPRGMDRGLLIDYSRGRNPWFDTIRAVRDPLVALEPGSADALLGVSFVAVAGAAVLTPTWFTLEREHPLAHVPEEARCG